MENNYFTTYKFENYDVEGLKLEINFAAIFIYGSRIPQLLPNLVSYALGLKNTVYVSLLKDYLV